MMNLEHSTTKRRVNIYEGVHDCRQPRMVVNVQELMKNCRTMTGHNELHFCIRGPSYHPRTTKWELKTFYETKHVTFSR